MRRCLFILLMILMSIQFYSEMTSRILVNEKIPIVVSDCNRLAIQGAVSLNEKTVTGFFVIDTGAVSTYLTPACFRALLPADVYERDIGDRKSVMFTVSANYVLQSVVIGNSLFQNVPVMAHDASKYISIEGRQEPVLGIIGRNILTQSSFYISFEKNYFIWTDSYIPTENSIRIPQRIVQGLSQNSYYPGTVTGFPHLAYHGSNSFIDTGSPGFLDFPGSASAILSEFNPVYYQPATTKYLQKICATTVAGELIFGGITFRNVPVTTGCSMFGPSVLIGIEALRYFNMYYQIGGENIVFLDRIETAERTTGTIIYKKKPGNMIFELLNGFRLDSNSVVIILYQDNLGNQLVPGLSVGDRLVKVTEARKDRYRFVFEKVDGSRFEFTR